MKVSTGHNNNNSSIAAVKKIDSRFGTNTSHSSTFSECSHSKTEVKHNVNKRCSAFKHYHSNTLEMQLFESALNPVEHSLMESQEQLKSCLNCASGITRQSINEMSILPERRKTKANSIRVMTKNSQ